jgi:hypothetical protein
MQKPQTNSAIVFAVLHSVMIFNTLLLQNIVGIDKIRFFTIQQRL